MKQIRASARVDPEAAPEFFNLLAHSDAVDEARVLEINTSLDGLETFLFAIEGDATAFEQRAADTPGVQSVSVSVVDDELAYAMLVMRPLETPLFQAIHGAGPMDGLVLRTPFVYRDGAMHGRAVGDPQALQDALDDAPEALDVQIDEIGTFHGQLDDPTTGLSDRQQEAIDAAHELGYYDQPRGATHEDVAGELNCAPQTASDHLQKAEAKVMAAILDEFGPSV